MKAVVVEEPKKLVIKDIPKPTFGENDILLKVKKVSLCNATDVHIYEGTAAGYLDHYPQILGHETFGEVDDLGKNVKNVKKGDRLVLYYLGALCEYIVFNSKNTIFGKVPDKVSDEIAPLCEMFHGSMVQTVYPAKIKKGEKVAIIGQGPMGLTTTQLVKAYGAGTIVAIDMNEFRLNMAKKLGADYIYDRSKFNAKELIEKIKKDVGEMDLSIVCVDIDLSRENDVYEFAAELLREKGRLTGLGVYVKGLNYKINPQTIYSKNLKIARSLEDVYPKKESLKKQTEVFQKAINWVAQGKINFKDMVSKILPMEKVEEGLFLCKNSPDKVIKVVISIEA